MEQYYEVDDQMKKILLSIYNDIFIHIANQNIIVFLCGGASSKYERSLRDKTRKTIEGEKRRYTRQYPIKIFYPEELLIDVLNRNKSADLLSYEQFLANNSHVIAIICESAGALVELGAFTNNKYTEDKVIAAIDKKRSKDKSFIMLGPIKYLRKKDKVNVVEYGNDESIFAKHLINSIRKKYEKKKDKEKINLNTIIGMHYFILVLLYFYKKVNSMMLANMIHEVEYMKNINIDNFDVLFSASLKLLFNNKYILKITNEKYSEYELTKDGYFASEKIIKRYTNNNKCDKIRVNIMYNGFYRSPHP